MKEETKLVYSNLKTIHQQRPDNDDNKKNVRNFVLRPPFHAIFFSFQINIESVSRWLGKTNNWRPTFWWLVKNILRLPNRYLLTNIKLRDSLSVIQSDFLGILSWFHCIIIIKKRPLSTFCVMCFIYKFTKILSNLFNNCFVSKIHAKRETNDCVMRLISALKCFRFQCLHTLFTIGSVTSVHVFMK